MPRQKTDKKTFAFYVYPDVSDDIDNIVSQTEKYNKVTRSAVVTAAIALTNQLLTNGTNDEKSAVMDLLNSVDAGA